MIQRLAVDRFAPHSYFQYLFAAKIILVNSAMGLQPIKMGLKQPIKPMPTSVYTINENQCVHTTSVYTINENQCVQTTSVYKIKHCNWYWSISLLFSWNVITWSILGRSRDWYSCESNASFASCWRQSFALWWINQTF